MDNPRAGVKDDSRDRDSVPGCGYRRYVWLDRIEGALGTALSDNARWRLQAIIVGALIALTAISIAEVIPWLIER